MLQGVEIRRVELALRSPVHTSAGEHRRRPVLLVRVTAGGQDGWGECGALAEGTAVDPGVERVWRALVDSAAPRLMEESALRGGALPEASEVAGLFGTSPAGRMAGAVIEMAVLDAELRRPGISLAARLGVERREVPAGAVVGIPPDRRVSSLVAAVGAEVDRGYRRVRLKIEPGWDVGPALAVAGEFPGLALQVDANGAYRLGGGRAGAAGGDGAVDAAERLAFLDPIGLACIEQPLAPADLAGHAALAGLIETPICLDESLTTPQRLREALRSGACEVACLKPARLGGLFAARRAHDDCLAAGVPAFVGGFFETGLARSVHAALAGLPGFTLPGDLSDPSEYLEVDPSGYPAPVGGQVTLPASPGVGAAPDAAILERLTVEVRRFAVPT